MLTKDLIRCSILRGAVRPRFVDTGNESLLGLAGQLLAVYAEDPPPTRGEIAEAVGPVIRAQSDVRLAKGLNKIIQDGCEFAHPESMDYADLRARLFRASAAAIGEGLPDDPQAFREDVLRRAELPERILRTGIYADLSENERLTRCRALGPRQLLERYNVSLVQSLLLRAEELTIAVASPDPAKMRRLLKYLRFFRLLVRIREAKFPSSRRGKAPVDLRLVVDGPASVFDQPKRYGLQLASFFPAVCALERWTLETRLEWKGASRPLRLTEKAGLVCHYRNFSAYVPEEILLFHRHFQEKVTDWRIVGHTPFLRIHGQEVVFPDLSFEHEGGSLVHLELFHRWHGGPLLRRLEQVRACPDLPLILGVDRSLSRESSAETALADNRWFVERGFLFRDYPTVARTLACLNAARQALG